MSGNAESFEDELRRELRAPVAPLGGFEERVLARALAAERRARDRWTIAAGVAAAVMLGVAGEGLHVRAEKRAEARQGFALAMRITGAALETALARGLDEQITKAVQATQEAGR